MIPLSSSSLADVEAQAHTTTTPTSTPPSPTSAAAGRISPTSSQSSQTTNTNSNASRDTGTTGRGTGAPGNQSALAQHSPAPTQPRQRQAPRPWWRPPARNFRPHPGNHAINSYITTSSLVVAGSSSDNTPQQQQQQPIYIESLPHYSYRALHYVLRIPFRELLGNVSRPYDPTAPLPLADVPLNATIVDTRTHTVYTNPYTGGRSSNTSNASSNINNSTNLPSNSNISSGNNTTRSRHYLPQIRKSWSDRTSSMSWAISTAFFSSVISVGFFYPMHPIIILLHSTPTFSTLVHLLSLLLVRCNESYSYLHTSLPPSPSLSFYFPPLLLFPRLSFSPLPPFLPRIDVK